MAKEKVFGVREVASFCPSGSEGIYVSRMLIDSESIGGKKINDSCPSGPPGFKRERRKEE